MNVNITFLGGSGTVTGSKYLVRYNGKTLLVDCGLFQGYKQLRLRNWQPLPVAPSQIDAVVLTHAHLDHSGYLPLLSRDGYAHAIHCTPGTRDLCAILLPDSGHLQEEDAAFLNRHQLSSHSPALPLYTRLDALHCMKQFHIHAHQQAFEPLPGWRVTFSPAGHILGAASVLLEVGGRRILFSGDLGRPDDLLMNPPDAPPQADTVLIESTYGDREHPPETLLEELGPALQRLAARGGVAVVPVFAVGRAQVVLHAIGLLKAQGVVPAALKVFLDSPMAVSTTGLFQHHMHEHRLNSRQVHALEHGATMVQTPEQSKGLAKLHGPMVILSASGMATGGRVLHHLALHAGDHRNMIILTGHQAPGTRGARLADGEKSIRIHGQDVAVRAEVVRLSSASAHADGTQLIAWLRSMGHAPDQVYVVHGEMGAADMLRQRIEHELRWRATVPEHGSTLTA
ncbi:MAG: MBL fold metallo-hydrolase [Gammaproteobacteria bacterium]|nr:MBL fold metallo-hydrolase [Gammaproteobacteria bacterium]